MGIATIKLPPHTPMDMGNEPTNGYYMTVLKKQTQTFIFLMHRDIE